MSIDSIDTATRELWENARTFFMMTLKTPEEKSQAERYFGLITSYELEGETFTIYTSSSFAAEFIRNDYANRLKGAFLMADIPNISIVVKVDSNSKPKLIVPTVQPTYYTKVQSTKPSGFISTLPLMEDYAFSTFVRGPSNSYAFSAEEGVVKNTAKPG